MGVGKIHTAAIINDSEVERLVISQRFYPFADIDVVDPHKIDFSGFGISINRQLTGRRVSGQYLLTYQEIA